MSETAGAAAKSIPAKLGAGAFVGPLIGLACAWLSTKAAASVARSPEERACILRYARYGLVGFCFVMSIGLALGLSQTGGLYTPSAGWLVLAISAWPVVGGIMLIWGRMDRQVRRIRAATNTTDEAYAKAPAAKGKQPDLPKYFESRTRLLGLPLFAMAWGGRTSDRYRTRTVRGWIAVGDIAVSPFLAFGGVAVAPIALGAITVGVLSLSVFWGVAFGVLAAGSLAFGWWAIGFAAAGVKCAVGFAAVARDYALGLVAGANEAGTAAALGMDLDPVGFGFRRGDRASHPLVVAGVCRVRPGAAPPAPRAEKRRAFARLRSGRTVISPRVNPKGRFSVTLPPRSSP